MSRILRDKYKRNDRTRQTGETVRDVSSTHETCRPNTEKGKVEIACRLTVNLLLEQEENLTMRFA